LLYASSRGKAKKLIRRFNLLQVCRSLEEGKKFFHRGGGRASTGKNPSKD